MALVAGLLVLWAVLLGSAGVFLHRLILGEEARLVAVPMTFVTGVAAATALLPLSWTLAGSPAPVLAIGVLSTLVLAFLVWRRQWSWGGAPLLVALGLGLLVALVVGGTFDEGVDGPFAYGSGAEPVGDVRAVDRLLDGGEAPAVPGFTSLAAATSWALGSDWTPYQLHAVFGVILLALLVGPLLLYSSWRGIGRLGTAVLLAIGVVTPALATEFAMAQPQVIFAALLVTSSTLALLLARRDRGWAAIAAIHLAALAAVGGFTPLLVPLSIYACWLLVGRGTREHKPSFEQPVALIRSAVPAAVAAAVGVAVALPAMLAGDGMPWRTLSGSAAEAPRVWPFVWIGPDLGIEVPTSGIDLAFFVVGPILLALVVGFALSRGDRRELAVAVGLLVVMAAGMLVAPADEATGIALTELALVLGSPLLAALSVRVIGLGRATAQSAEYGFWIGAGPALLIAVFGAVSFAMSVNTLLLARPAPVAAALMTEPSAADAPAFVTSSDPWVPYLLGPTTSRVPAVSDLDEIAAQGGGDSLIFGPWASVVRPSDPLASDAPAQLCVINRDGPFGVTEYQRSDRCSSAYNPVVSADGTPLRPLFHHPAEAEPGTGPGGVLLPVDDIPDTPDGSPDAPVEQVSCPQPAAALAGFGVAGGLLQDASEGAGDADEAADAAAEPVIIAGDGTVAAGDEVDRAAATEVCFDVKIPEPDVGILAMHAQIPGIVIEPSESLAGDGWKPVDGPDGATWYEATRERALAEYSAAGLAGPQVQLIIEGDPAAGLEVLLPGGDGEAVATVHRGHSRWHGVQGVSSLNGIAHIRAVAPGARIGRLVARPLLLPDEMDILVDLAEDGRRVATWSIATGGERASLAVLDVTAGPGESRIARVRLRVSDLQGTAMSPDGFRVLVDWFEGYPGAIEGKAAKETATITDENADGAPDELIPPDDTAAEE